MGDRVSIQFIEKKSKFVSAILSSHWDGMYLVDEANLYLNLVKRDIDNNVINRGTPLGRLEADAIMYDFIRWKTEKGIKNKYIDGGYRLVTSLNHVDNSDNGHHLIEV